MVEGSGPLNAELWLIGEAPGEQEEVRGIPFVGMAGQFLRTKINNCGISDKDIRFENLSNIRPPKNDFTYFEQNETQRIKLLENIEKLKTRIGECKPNFVLCLGAKPLRYLMEQKDVGTWRGHIFMNGSLGCKTMCTYHPSFCLRQRHVSDKMHPGQAEALFSADLQKAVDNCKTRSLSFPAYELLIQPSFLEARDELKRLIEEAKILSYDIETIGSFMDCIGFCAQVDRTCCIPLYNPSRTEVTPYWKSGLEQLEILRLIKQLLESDIPKVAQNSQFDSIILEEFYGIEVRNLVWDTMIAAHNIYCELPKDLGTLISLYTNLPYHKYLLKTGLTRDRWEYNATDALANLHIREGQLKEMQKYGILRHYYCVSNAAIRPLIQMQMKGILVDETLKEKAQQREEYIMEDMIAAFDQIFPVRISSTKGYKHKFNPLSTKDKIKLFYGLLKCRKHYNRSILTTDQEAMEKIVQKEKGYAKVLAEACVKYKEASSMAGRLKTPLRKGRMHTAYDISGTDTGRLSSKESLFGTGTNLQNLKDGVQRQMLIPG